MKDGLKVKKKDGKSKWIMLLKSIGRRKLKVQISEKC